MPVPITLLWEEIEIFYAMAIKQNRDDSKIRTFRFLAWQLWNVVPSVILNSWDKIPSPHPILASFHAHFWEAESDGYSAWILATHEADPHCIHS